MTVSDTARRIRAASAAVVASAAVAAACTGCSSSSNGTGNPASGFPTSAAAPGTTAPVGSPSSASLGGGSATPPIAGSSAGGGGSQSGSAFCQDFNPRDVANIGKSGDIGKLTQIFDKVAADAPSAIKAQAEDVDKFLHDAESGNVDQSKASQITTEVEDITKYYLKNCS